MSNHIKLEFSKSVTRLAGNEYGRSVYNSQVRNAIDFSQTVTIEFPEHIVSVASSFVQGFFEEIIMKVGILGIGDKVIVIAPGMDVEKKIIRNLQ